MSSTTSSDRISASGRVIRVAPSFVYINSEQYGSIFAYPAAYFNWTPEKLSTQNLQDVLRIDDVVHFVAVPQNGPNDCKWIAVKITKKQQLQKPFSPNLSTKFAQSNDDSSPEFIRNAKGTILEIYDKNGTIFSEKYGKIYLPMAASADTDSNELYPLNELFDSGDSVLFDAQRQPSKNDCRYFALRVRHLLAGDRCEDNGESTVVEGGEKLKNKNQEPIALSTTKLKIDGQQNQNSDTMELKYEEGDIVNLFAQYGFIRSEKLGSVYFTMAHYENETAINCLPDDLSLGDRVRFLPMVQPEKNGCRWRGIKVKKLGFDVISSLAQMVDNGDQSTTIACEVSVQTDQSLWNTFLASQVSYRRRDRDPKTTTSTENAACQTRMPPEALLLKAVKEDDELKVVLKERFPHLMLFLDKTT